MAASGRKVVTVLKEVDEGARRTRMSSERREENAKDAEREAKGEW